MNKFEQRISTPRVAGSSPAGIANKNPYISKTFSGFAAAKLHQATSTFADQSVSLSANVAPNPRENPRVDSALRNTRERGVPGAPATVAIETAAFRKPRLLALDLLRGLAALMVAIGHTAAVIPEYFGPAYSMCVAFFFLLSGYVLSHAYGEAIANGRMSLAQFIVARLARLYPLHLLTWAATFAVLVHQGVANSDWLLTPAALENITLTPSLFTGTFSFNAPAWSIGAEFWSGILFFALCSRRPRLRAAAIGLALILFAACELRDGFLVQFRERYGICLGLFLLGWCLFKLRPSISPLTGWLAAAAGFALSLFPPFPLQHHALADLPYYVVFAIAIAGLADVPLRGIAARIAEFSGDISFGVYLWHWPFLMVMHPKTPAELAAFLALVMSTATTSLRYFERPAQSLVRNIASAWLDGPA